MSCAAVRNLLSSCLSCKIHKRSSVLTTMLNGLYLIYQQLGESTSKAFVSTAPSGRNAEGRDLGLSPGLFPFSQPLDTSTLPLPISPLETQKYPTKSHTHIHPCDIFLSRLTSAGPGRAFRADGRITMIGSHLTYPESDVYLDDKGIRKSQL